jgi:hypothetical protein
MALRNSSAISGLTADSLPGVQAATYPSCCNCTLKETERPHPVNYGDSSHANEEMLRRKLHKLPKIGQQ